MAKWLDKYENGGEYLGTTNVGRNYSPAWGGQFQMGGTLQPPMAGAVQTVPMAQTGTTQSLKDSLNLSSFLNEKFEPSISFMPRVNLSRLPDEFGINVIPGTSFTASPTERLSLNVDVDAPFMVSKRGVQGLDENNAFNYNIGADYQLGKNDYIGLNYDNNQGANLTYRHTIGNRKKKKAEAGTSLPGSVGFTYARTQDIPSEGPYAKKTLPSAQTGYSSKPFEMVWKENAPSKKSTNNVERYEPSNAVKNAKSTLAVASLAGSSNPVTQYLAQIAGGTGDLYTSARYAMDKNWGKAGEDFVQGALGFIPYSKAIQGMKGDYFTKGAQFFNKWLKRAHAASDVKTLSESPKNTKLPRHENGGSMSFYQHGLDWTPRNISEDGSEIPMAQEGKSVKKGSTAKGKTKQTNTTNKKQDKASDLNQKALNAVLSKLPWNQPVSKKPIEVQKDDRYRGDIRTNFNIKSNEQVLNEARSRARQAEKKVQKLINYKNYNEKAARRAVQNKTEAGERDLKEIERVETRAAAHPDFQPGIGWGQMQALSEAGDLRSRLLRGSNLLTNTGNPVTDLATGIVTAPGRAFANITTDAQNRYFNPILQGNVLEGVTNFGLDLFDAAPVPAAKAASFVGQGAKNVAQQTGEYLTKGPLKNAYKYNPWAFKPKKNAAYRMIGGDEGFEDALTSGVFRPNQKRGKYDATFYNVGEPLGRYSSSDDLQYIVEVPLSNKKIYPRFEGDDYRISEDLGAEIFENRIPQGHVSINDPGVKIYKQNWLRGYKEVPKPTSVSSSVGNTDFIRPLSPEDLDFLNPPKFIQALGKIVTPGDRIVAPALAAEVINRSLSNEQKEKLPKGFREHLEKMANQFNIKSELQQKKQGGVVKDNKGYWNPDNWGKVVEIDSPNITMRGVNQDLIGISDEGDVQYMEPGKDYKFKGKKVKEYPVAQKGKKVIVDGKEYDTDSAEYAILLNSGLVGTMKDGVFYGSKAELDPITIIGSKDKDTQDFYNYLYDEKLTNTAFNAFAELGEKYGFPKVSLMKKGESSGIFDPNLYADYSSKNNWGGYRPNYRTGRVHLGKASSSNIIDNYLAELAHYVQFKDKGPLDTAISGLGMVGNIVGNMITNLEPWSSAYEKEYDRKGSIEHEAHEIIEPELQNAYDDMYIKHRREKRDRDRPGFKKTGGSVSYYQPIAKYGVNQQDEKTAQHLDQLLNFTNKPKAKNGWLDKYQ